MCIRDRAGVVGFEDGGVGFGLGAKALVYSSLILRPLGSCDGVPLSLIHIFNLLWLPALGFIVLPLSFLGLIAAAAGLEQAAGFLLHLANIPCEALLHSLRWLQAHAGLDLFVSPRPHWTAILGFGAIAVALAMRIHRDLSLIHI